ncbi:hypothetical protein A6U84_25635 (plasmid) [Agrobacterium sp. 13-2099-1-2]|nr:hypothetical protein [Agrobacterium sp. 13-2099-1-2]UZX45527.1 hypothetical protein A6U84_25635 [Agrobacterium sp. 13-2099-1-2]
MMRTVIAIFMLVVISGCGTVKEVSAPCKRPANLTAFVDDPRLDCGPMRSVNGDQTDALVAIDSILLVAD